MALPQPLYVGDCVRTIAPITELPIGLQGIVRAIFPLGDLYDVFFAEGFGLRIVHRAKLEHLGDRRAVPQSVAAKPRESL